MYYKDPEHLYVFLITPSLHGDSSGFGAEETNLILFTIITDNMIKRISLL